MPGALNTCSLQDQEREDRLRDCAGYEHLKERLHVLLIAEDRDERVCAEKLQRAVAAVDRLLTPQFDGYKRQQLIQLAIINGTYRQ